MPSLTNFFGLEAAQAQAKERRWIAEDLQCRADVLDLAQLGITGQLILTTPVKKWNMERLLVKQLPQWENPGPVHMLQKRI